MSSEAIPRLAIELRSVFPDARIELRDSRSMRIRFPSMNGTDREMEIATKMIQEQGQKQGRGHDLLQLIETGLVLRYECLQGVPVEDVEQLIASENAGLRGVTVTSGESNGTGIGANANTSANTNTRSETKSPTNNHAGSGSRSRVLRLRTGFIGQKGRSIDERENLVIDILSLVRFARLFDDRILRSRVGEAFCYEIYRSQYGPHHTSQGRARTRYVNYARSIFKGSQERAFHQLIAMLREDYKYRVVISSPGVASVFIPGAPFEVVLRVPEDIPIVTSTAMLRGEPHTASAIGDRRPSMTTLVNRLNRSFDYGHFETSPNGRQVSFSVWKHLTNDLRLFALDHMISAVARAGQAFSEAIAASEAIATSSRPTTGRESSSASYAAEHTADDPCRIRLSA